MLEKKETGSIPKVIRNISELLEHYLNFPSKLLESALVRISSFTNYINY